MKITALFIIIALVPFHKTFCQAKSAGAGAAPAAAATTTGNSQTGYVYRLKYRYHLKYGMVHKVTAPLPSPPVGQTSARYTSHIRIAKFQSPNNRVLTNGPTGSQPQGSCSKCPPMEFCEDDSVATTTICVTQGCTVIPVIYPDSVYIDSLSRYWNTPYWSNSGPFAKVGRYRMRVSVTQADSGKLTIGLYDTNYLAGNRGGPVNARILSFDGASNNDYAIPITTGDSAASFYLQVKNKLTAGSPIAYISLPYSLTQFGAFTVPFKYRWAQKNTSIRMKQISGSADSVVSGPSESTASINLAAYVGRKWGRTRFYFDPTRTHNTTSFMLAAFAGPCLVPLSNTNIIAADSNVLNTPTNIIALSTGGAAVFEWRFIDIGIFGGTDIPLVSNSGWIYRDKFWIGFGIGVNLGMFSTGTSQAQ